MSGDIMETSDFTSKTVRVSRPDILASLTLKTIHEVFTITDALFICRSKREISAICKHSLLVR